MLHFYCSDFPVTMRKVVFGMILVIGCLPIHTMGACTAQGSCPSVGYFFALGKNMVDKHSLLEFVTEIFTVSSPNECFRRCRLNCQCISFNYRTAQNIGNCELNTENRHLQPFSLHPDPSAQYYDLVIDYNVVVRCKL